MNITAACKQTLMSGFILPIYSTFYLGCAALLQRITVGITPDMKCIVKELLFINDIHNVR